MADEDQQEDIPAEAEEAQAEGEGDGEEGTEGESSGGSGKKKLLLILVPIILLAGGGAGLYFTGMLDSLLGGSSEEHAEGEEGDHGEGGDHAADDGHGGGDKHGDGHGDDGHGGGSSGAFIEIPTMLVNLNSDDGNPRYLKLTVQLELEDPSKKESVEAVIPRVVDQFQTYLRELRVRDLRGSAGIYRLQMELLWRVNKAASPNKVKDVLFQEILIQ